ncbi:MAG: hypothetical protein ACWIPH_00305 [Ostreibacterium sp.]
MSQLHRFFAGASVAMAVSSSVMLQSQQTQKDILFIIVGVKALATVAQVSKTDYNLSLKIGDMSVFLNCCEWL